MKTTKQTLTTKSRRTTSKGKSVPIGGVIFSSIVFIVLSMMVMYQTDVLHAFQNAMMTTQSRLNVTRYDRSTELTRMHIQLQDSQNQLNACHQQTINASKENASTYESFTKILAITDLDERLLAFSKPDSTEPLKIFVRRASPNGKRVAVIYGTEYGAKYFFVREKGLIIGESGAVGDWNHLEIANVRWVDERTITYDLRIVDEGGTTVQENTYQLP